MKEAGLSLWLGEFNSPMGTKNHPYSVFIVLGFSLTFNRDTGVYLEQGFSISYTLVMQSESDFDLNKKFCTF